MKMDKREETIQHLLQTGVRYKLPAPFFLRWLKPSITLKAHKAGTILLFSKVVLENKMEESLAKEDVEFLSKSIRPICECLAISALNGRRRIWLFKKIFTKYLLWYVHQEYLVQMFLVAFELNNANSFKTITKWYVHQTQMMMNPNLGQIKSGS